jgi:hypothetical protein
MPCHAMHPIQDLFLESFSYELQFDMHFYMHSYLQKKIYSCKKWVLHQLPLQLLTWSLYHCFAYPISENGNAFHLSASWFIPDIMRVAHISSKSCICLYGFSTKPRAKFNSLTKDMKSGWISYPVASMGCSEVAGYRYFPSGAKKL